MKWNQFIELICSELQHGDKLADFGVAFEDEHSLTRAISLGIRDLFTDTFRNQFDPSMISHHVVYRQGDTPQDKEAWNRSQSDKWIRFHGVRFVPDILIRRQLNNVEDILPVEVKFIKKSGAAQGVATAIGQAMIYGMRYPRTIVFIGIDGGVRSAKYNLEETAGVEEKQFNERLEQRGIHFILRKIGPLT